MDKEPPCGCATDNSHLFIYLFIYLFTYLFIYLFTYSQPTLNGKGRKSQERRQDQEMQHDM